MKMNLEKLKTTLEEIECGNEVLAVLDHRSSTVFYAYSMQMQLHFNEIRVFPEFDVIKLSDASGNTMTFHEVFEVFLRKNHNQKYDMEFNLHSYLGEEDEKIKVKIECTERN